MVIIKNYSHPRISSFFFIITPWNYWRHCYIYTTHLQFGLRTSFWFRHVWVLVFRKTSFPIDFNFSPLASIIFIHFFMKLQFMDTFRITFNYDSAHALSLGVLQDVLSDSLQLLSACRYKIYSLFDQITFHEYV